MKDSFLRASEALSTLTPVLGAGGIDGALASAITSRCCRSSSSWIKKFLVRDRESSITWKVQCLQSIFSAREMTGQNNCFREFKSCNALHDLKIHSQNWQVFVSCNFMFHLSRPGIDHAMWRPLASLCVSQGRAELIL